MNTTEDDREQAEYLRKWGERHPDTFTARGGIVLLILLAVFASLIGSCAFAETVTLTCSPPTKNTDGTAITAALTYKAYWGTSPTTLTNTAPMSS